MYFEVDDIKHRHNAYWDCYNVHGHIDPPDSSLSWNYTRGAIAGLMGYLPVEVATFINGRYKHLKTRYEPPRNLKELGLFMDGIKRTDGFHKALRNRVQFGTCIALFDIAPRFATYFYLTAGYWSGDEHGGANPEFWRKIFPTIFAAMFTGALAHPFEIVKAAHMADETFPKELQKGYKSYFDALRRVPQEEGLTYMSRGMINTFARNSLQTMFFFYFFDFWKDFFHPLVITNSDWPYEIIKASGLFVGASVGCVASYPFGVLSKQLCELSALQKDGSHPMSKNYRIAMRDLWFTHNVSALYPGFSRVYYWRTMPWMFVSGWIADDLGIFTHWKTTRLTYTGSNSVDDLYV